MPWSKQFDEPIILPDGRELLTLRDAANYITKLPKAGHEMETLLLVAERDGPEMLARIAVMKALNRHSANETPDPRRKPAKVFGSFGDHASPHANAAFSAKPAASAGRLRRSTASKAERRARPA